MPAWNRASISEGWRRFRAIVKACFNAAFNAAVISAVLSGIVTWFFTSLLDHGLNVFIVAVAYGLPIALVGTVAIGAPTHLLLLLCGTRSIWAHLCAGTMAGGIILAGLLWHQIPPVDAVCWAFGAPVAAATLWRDLVRRVERQQSAADLVSLF